MENHSYSPKEIAMFAALGMDDERLASLTIEDRYTVAINYVHLEGMTGPAVESLIRCVRALEHGTHQRGTQAFDELIQLAGKDGLK